MDSTGLSTILIVDDEPDIREILCFNLEQAGYRCVQAADGRQALERLTVNNEQLTVDLVLLDIMMPGMSGYDVARKFRLVAAIEKRHEERYRALLKNIENDEVFQKSEVKVWECRNCGHIVVGTKAPELCPTCAHPQSYFEVHVDNF